MAVRTKTQLVTKNGAVIRRNGPASQSKTNGLDHYDLNLDIIDTLFDEAARLQLPEYNPSTSYRLGEGILVDGVIYRSIAAATGPFNAAHWQPLSTPGNGNNAAGDALKETITQANHGFAVGTLLRSNGTAWVRSLAVMVSDTDYSAEVAGMVTSVISDNVFVLTSIGLADVSALNLDPQKAYFLSPTVPGAITPIAPTLENQIVKPVLLTRTAGTAFVLQMTGEVLGPGGTGPGTAKTFDPAFFTDTASVVSLANSAVTAGTYGSSSQIPVIQVDAKGRITGVSLVAVAGGGTGGVDSFDRFPNRAAFPATGDNEKIYLAQDTNRLYVWNGSNNYVETAASAVFSVNGKTGAVSLNTDDIAEAATNRWFTAAREAALNASIAAKFTLPSGSAGQFLNHLGQFSAPPVGGSYTDAQARAAVIDNVTLFLDRAWSSQTTKAYVDAKPTGITNINGLTGSTISLDASEILLEGFTLSTTAIAPGIDLQIAFGRLQGQVNARFTLPTGGLATEYLNGLGQRAAFAEVTVSGAFTLSATGVATLGTGVVAAVNISQMSATTGQALVWNGSAWAPATVAGGGGSSALAQFQLGVGNGSNTLSGLAELTYQAGRLRLGNGGNGIGAVLQAYSVGAIDQYRLQNNLYYNGSANVKYADTRGAANIYTSIGITNENTEIGFDLFPVGATVTNRPAYRAILNAAGDMVNNRFYGSLGVGTTSPAKAMLAVGDSQKATPLSLNFQLFTANANVDQGFIGWNKYWDGAARVRQNTSLTGMHFTSNVGAADANAVFGAVFTTVAGAEKNIFYGYMDAAANVYFTIPDGVRFGLGSEAVSNELYTVRGTEASAVAQLRYGLNAIITYNPSAAAGGGYEGRAMGGDAYKEGAFSAHTLTGLVGVARQNGSGAVTVLAGGMFQGNIISATPGAVTHLAGLHASISCQGVSGTATVTNGYGVFIGAPTQQAAQVFSGTNLYGIYIQDQRGVANQTYLVNSQSVSSGTWANRYAIFSAGGKVNLSNLPTSAAGLVAGDLWNNGGTISIV